MPQQPDRFAVTVSYGRATSKTLIGIRGSASRIQTCNPGYVSGKICLRRHDRTGFQCPFRQTQSRQPVQSVRATVWTAPFPEIYEAYNPMSYDTVREMEEELAIDLREGGYRVWQA
jgi:hypothetical protein